MNSIPVVNEMDKRTGIIAAVLLLLLVFLFLFLVKYTIADPPPKDHPLVTEMVIPLELNLKKMLVVGGGSGSPTDAKITDKTEAQTQQIATKAESKTTTKTGKSNHSTQNHDPNNQATTTKKSENPFGSGGSGGGNEGGNGKGFGQDTGAGAGAGNNGGRKPRIRLTDPNNEGIVSDHACKIELKVTVNAEGTVVKAENIVAQTTTVNQIVINQVIANAKSQVKYNKAPGTGLEIEYITIYLSAR